MADASVHRYGGIAQIFHWLTAILIFAMFGLGWYMTDLELADPGKFRLYQIHKSLGITIFVLAFLRLAWRLTHKAPPWPDHMAGWERMAAAGAHWALYGLIFLQPLLGVLQSNAANFPIVFWGGVELPALIGQDQALGERLLGLHHLLANALAGLVLLHVGAAVRHHIMLKDDVLRNMAPSAGAGAAAVVLALLLLVPPFLLTDASQPTEAVAAGETKAAPAALSVEMDDVLGEAWTVRESSALGFIAQQQGSPVEGGFGSFDAEIIFDPDDLKNSRLSVDIDVTTISSGHSDRDKTLNSPSFFDTATWPSAAFKSSSITAKSDGRYEAAGTLTLRDVTLDVVLPFSLVIEPDADDPAREHAHAKGELPIMRLDYGVGQGDWASTGTVANEVIITIDIKASRTQPR